VNESVTFYDASYHDPVSWNWTVAPGVSLSGASPSYVYPAAGKYDIQLNVSDGTDQMTQNKPGYLQILAATGRPMPYLEGFENWTDVLQSDILAECEGALCYQIQNTAAATGQKSVRVQNGGGEPGLLYRLTTPRLDLSQTPDPVIRFKYAFAQKDTPNTDKLLVKISKDCGNTWFLRKTILPAEMATVTGTVSGTFVPTAADWREVAITSIPSMYLTNNVIVRFEFYSGGGNDFYLDDINVFDASTASVKEPGLQEWYLAPNPTSEGFRIDGPFPMQDVEIFSMDGKRLFVQANFPTGNTVSVDGLPAGIYQVKMTYKGIVAYRKLLVTK